MKQHLLYEFFKKICHYILLLKKTDSLVNPFNRIHVNVHPWSIYKEEQIVILQTKGSYYKFLSCFFLISALFLSSINTFGQYAQLWETQSFQSGQNSFETSHTQEVDSKGNLIILGYNSPAWQRENLPNDQYKHWGSEEIYNEGTRISLFKFSADGKLLWSKALPSSSKYDAPGKLLLDKSDNIYISVSDADGGSFISKYAPGGQQVWQLSGTQLNRTSIKDFAIDANNAVYLVGSSNGYISTQKLSAEGVPQWESKFTGSDGEGARAYLLALDNKGALYITTKITVDNPCKCGAMGWDNITLVKYDATNGNQLLSKDYEFEKIDSQYQYSPSNFKYPAQLLTTPSGFVYLVVNQHDGMYGYQTIVFKINSNGEIIWSKIVNTTTVTSLQKAVLAENESLILLCRENTYRNYDDFYLTKFSKDGQKAWSKYINDGSRGKQRRYLIKDMHVNNERITLSGSTDSLTIYNSFPPNIEEHEKNTSYSAVYNQAGELIWRKKGVIDPAKLYYGLGAAHTNDALFTLAGVNSDIKSHLIATKYIVGSIPEREAWVSQTHTYDKAAGSITVNWKLNVSEARAQSSKLNIYHSSTENGQLQSYEWEMPAGQTDVGAAYTYKLSNIGTTENLVMGLVAGTGYKIPNTQDKPKEVKINIKEVTGSGAPVITTGALTVSKVCSGATLSVSFSTEGNFNSGNVFTAQLSNASGSFASPVNIGSGATSPVNVTIPASTAQGVGYRIRVIASMPAITGTDNGTNFTISSVPDKPGTISGTITVCAGAENLTYSIDAVTGATGYTWSATGFDIIAGQGTRSITLKAGNTSGKISVTAKNDCGNSASSELAISVTQMPAITVTAEGGSTVCEGGTIKLSSTTGTGYTYQWIRNGIPITGANAATYSVNSSGNYAVKVTNNAGCSATSAATEVKVNAPFTVDPGDNQTICANASAFNLSGHSPAGGNWSGKGVTAAGNFNPATAGTGTHTLTYTVTKDNCTVTGTKTITVAPAVAKPGTIAGGSSACAGSDNLTFSVEDVEGAKEYMWSAPGFDIRSGQGTRSVVIKAGSASGKISVIAKNSCGASAASEKEITITPIPAATITATGSTSLCSGGAVKLSANTSSNMTYRWSRDGQVISGATSESFTASASGSYTVTVSNGNCSRTSAAVVVEVSAGISSNTISGNQNICAGTSPAAIAGSTPTGGNNSFSYTWEQSTNGTAFIPVQGAADKNFTPGNLTATTWFRRKVTSGSCVSTSEPAKISVTAMPAVSLGVYEAVCHTASPITLSGGSPTGGTYSGTGISNGIFNPATAGPGTHTITYTYQDPNGCEARATQTILVKADCNVTGIEDKEPQYELLVFPNPAIAEINVQLELEKRTDLIIRVVDARGNIIAKQEFRNVQGEFKRKLDLKNVATGMFLLQFITEEGVKTRRIIVQQ